MQKKSPTQIKEFVQDEIMHLIGNMSYMINENPDLDQEDKEIYKKEAKKQMDRIAKMFGYKESWFN